MKGNLPAKPHSAAPALAGQTLNRVRAIVDDAIALATSGKVKNKAGQDLAHALAQALVDAPDKVLGWVFDRLGEPAARAAAGGLAVGSIGTLYLQALQQAQPQPGDAAKVIEGSGTRGVQPELSHGEDW